LLPGDLVGNGRRYSFKDPSAKNGPGAREGLYKVQMKIAKGGQWKLKLRAFRDLSAANEPAMTLSITVGGQMFVSTNSWDQLKNGWRLKRLPL
jgi:hypothetical protein